MELASLNRWKAALIHLGISAAIGVGVVALMLFVWYSRPYFTAMGGDTLILLLIGVDVVIGPLITLTIFDPKKKGLRFDLSVIAAVQLAALAYGAQGCFDETVAWARTAAAGTGARVIDQPWVQCALAEAYVLLQAYAVLGNRVAFRRTLNPHAGSFFLSAAQMEHWARQPYFLDRDTRFIGPLESAKRRDGVQRTS